jgi:hypothetical protein
MISYVNEEIRKIPYSPFGAERQDLTHETALAGVKPMSKPAGLRACRNENSACLEPIIYEGNSAEDGL